MKAFLLCVLFACAFAQPSFPNDFSSDIIVLVTRNGQNTNQTGVLYQNYAGQMARYDIIHGITFENLFRYDMNMSYVIAEGHCYDRALFNSMQPYWYWLVDSNLGHECHSTYFNKVGTAWVFNDGNGVLFTLCASNDGSYPYYVLASEDNGQTFAKTIFTNFNTTVPDKSFFQVPSQC